MSSINRFSRLTVCGMLTMLAFGTSVAGIPPDISGTYTCSYHDPLSTPPDGTEKIVIKQNGDTWKISQIGMGGVVPYGYGYGLFNKNIDNAFTYIYWLPKTATITNVVFYMIKPDGSLDGVFGQSNTDKTGTETCTKSS